MSVLFYMSLAMINLVLVVGELYMVFDGCTKAAWGAVFSSAAFGWCVGVAVASAVKV